MISKGFSKYLAEILLIIVTILWGGTFVIVKESLNDVSSMLFIALRFSIAAVILIPIIIKKRKYFNKDVIMFGSLLGAALFLGFSTQTVGLKYTSATKSAFITGSVVVIIPILQTIIDRKLPKIGSIIGIIFVFFGIVFLSSSGNDVFQIFNELGANFNQGDVYTLFCAVFFAVYIVYLGHLSDKYDFWVLLSMQILTTAVLGFVSSFVLSTVNFEVVRIEFTNNLLFGLLYTSILATLITTALQTKYQKFVSASKAGIIYSFEPIFAAVFAFFILNEKISNFGIVGSALIFTGLFFSEIFDLIFKNGKLKKS